MRWVSVCLLAAVAAAGIGAGRTGGSVIASQVACLHGESEAPDQTARRQAALGFTRQINTLQARGFQVSQAYQPLAGLGLTSPAPEGFAIKLSTDGTGYSFSVVDEMDPCRFGFFSNEAGVIYKGEVIR